MERTSGSQIAATNIIIQRVRNYTIKGDKEGRQDLDDVGSGTGYFICDGRVTDIKWSKKSRSAPTVYTDASGKEIVLNPGQTWINIVPIWSKVRIN